MYNKKLLFFLCCIVILLGSLIIIAFRNQQILQLMAVKPYPTAAYNPPRIPTTTPYPTTFIRPAEQCSITNGSDSRDIYTCTHFVVQIPHGWYPDYGGGQDTANGRLLSVSEFSNYDYRHAEGRDFDPVKDQGKQKFSIILLISNTDLDQFMTDFEKQNNWSNVSNVPFTINNYKTIKVVSEGLNGTKNSTYFIQNPSKTIVLEYSGIFGIDDTFSEKILSSLKFTDYNK